MGLSPFKSAPKSTDVFLCADDEKPNESLGKNRGA